VTGSSSEGPRALTPAAVAGPAPVHPQWGTLQHLEGLFNPLGQQRGGLLWCLLKTRPGRDRDHPVLAGLSRGAFNSNPVMAGYLAACLALRLAREARETDSVETEEAVERIRGLFAPLLSGIGDRIFYGGVRPLLSLVAILTALLWFGEPALWYWLGYNAIHVYWRRHTWSVGWQGEEAIRREIRGHFLGRWASGSAKLARFFLGLTLGAALAGLWLGQGAMWSGALLVICGLGFLLMSGGRVRPLAWGWIGILVAGGLALVRLALEKGKV
jgi:hypothetical protein